jgi:site-specific DNA recombinase
VYTRLSSDPSGLQTATRRQEEACRSFASARGWTVQEVFEDVDVSAYRRGVQRPAYERLLAGAAQGAFDGVLVWRLDRLMRRPAEFERFWSSCEQHGMFLASVTEPIDSSTELGLIIVRILVNFAQLESATKSERLRAKSAEMARAGRPPGGPTPFGYTPGLEAVVPEEAALLRDAARRLVDGDSLRAICRDWHRQGVLGRKGAPVTPAALRVILRSRRLVGERTLRGEVVATGCWPPILDPLVAAQVRALLADRMRRPTRNRSRRLLTGLLLCGECGGQLGGRKSNGRRSYGCVGPRGVPHVQVAADLAESWVVAVTIFRLGRRRPRGATMGELEATETELAELNQAFFVDRQLAAEDYRRLRLAVLRRAQRVVPTVEPLPITTELFTRLPFPQQREAIDSEVSTLTVGRATPGGGRFEPERLRPAFRVHDVDMTTFHWTPPRRRPTGVRLRESGDVEWVRVGELEVASDHWMLSPEAASRLGISTATLTTLRARGAVSAYRLGSAHVFREEDVDDYLAGCAVVPGTMNRRGGVATLRDL